jgi:tRNA-Thr(GGU) m(6)t(6)A37 methyltransferase TsaA
MDPTTPQPLQLTPIGVVRSPFREKREAPRQAIVAAEATGTLELFAGHGYEHALRDLAGWDRIWVLFWFHEAKHFAPTVLPPRSDVKRGLFATRSPHRPNPIGLSAVKLLGVEGLTVRVAELDILDGTPLLDVKPYVPYADAFPEAGTGWLADEGTAATHVGLRPEDPRAPWKVQFTPNAEGRIAFLEARGLAPRSAVVDALSLGPAPHPYRRIREKNGVPELASKDWRFPFSIDASARTMTVLTVRSGHRPADLFGTPPAENDPLTTHRDFVATFADGM